MSHPWAAGSAMLSNAEFIKQELPKIHLDEEMRAQIAHLCAEWESIYFDLIDCGPELAERWVRQGMNQAHDVVQMLDAASKADRRYGSAYLLVCESAVNVLNAYSGKAVAA